MCIQVTSFSRFCFFFFFFFTLLHKNEKQMMCAMFKSDLVIHFHATMRKDMR